MVAAAAWLAIQLHTNLINSFVIQSELAQHAAVITVCREREGDRVNSEKLGQKQDLAAGRGDVSSFSFSSSVRL